MSNQVKYGEFTFPSEFGFTKSNGSMQHVKGYTRGGGVKKYAKGGHVMGNVGTMADPFKAGGGHSTEGMASKMTRNNHVTPIQMTAKPAGYSKYAKGGTVGTDASKMAKVDVHKHERKLHPGKPLTPLKKGGMAKKMSTGGLASGAMAGGLASAMGAMKGAGKAVGKKKGGYCG